MHKIEGTTRIVKCEDFDYRCKMRINFELLDIRAFLAVLDFSSFNKATKVLNMSQPALSRRIQSLEASIGTPLLERSSRSVGPTAAGRSFAPLARRLIEEFEE